VFRMDDRSRLEINRAIMRSQSTSKQRVHIGNVWGQMMEMAL
jgi:hypothetical protein